jgi:hypothetical protein
VASATVAIAIDGPVGKGALFIASGNTAMRNTAVRPIPAQGANQPRKKIGSGRARYAIADRSIMSSGLDSPE